MRTFSVFSYYKCTAWSVVKLKFHGSSSPRSILARMSATSRAYRARVASWTEKSPRPTRRRHPREDPRQEVARVGEDVTRMLRGNGSGGIEALFSGWRRVCEWRWSCTAIIACSSAHWHGNACSLASTSWHCRIAVVNAVSVCQSPYGHQRYLASVYYDAARCQSRDRPLGRIYENICRRRRVSANRYCFVARKWWRHQPSHRMLRHTAITWSELSVAWLYHRHHRYDY